MDAGLLVVTALVRLGP